MGIGGHKLGLKFYGRVTELRNRLSRARFFRGHGVHSPFVYDVVRNVFMRDTLLPGDRALFRELLAAGVPERRAVQLQNLAIHCGYATFGLNRADAEFCIATRSLSRTETLALVGDAAAAVLLEPTTEDVGVIDHILRSDGMGRVHLHMKAGGSLKPPTIDTVLAREHYIYQEGQPVFKHAVSNMADVSVEVMKRNNLTSEDVAWLVPHQANLRIIKATGERMGLPKEKVMVNIHKYGNTTSATIPLCLYEWEDQLKKGDNLILAAFGAGFTWGAIYLKWGYTHKG